MIYKSKIKPVSPSLAIIPLEKLYNLPYANSKTAGVIKLYDEIGDNIDGSMTQRAITKELEKKVGASIEGETIFFIN